MKKLPVAIVLMLALTISTVGIVGAITDGEQDAGRHPYVGLMGAYDSDGNFLWRCSGTLLSSTVFLTAGHCTEPPAVHAEIWFEEHIDIGLHGYPYDGDVGGTTYTHPDYSFPYYDVGVVVLDKKMKMDTYGELPTVDQFDSLQNGPDTWFTAVGYGLQESFPDAASWKEHNVRDRMVAYPWLLQINAPGFTGDFSLLLSNNPHSGGTCFGDSGGPNFLGDSTLIAGITSYGLNYTCAGTGGVFRTDRQDVLDFINSFLD